MADPDPPRMPPDWNPNLPRGGAGMQEVQKRNLLADFLERGG